MTDAQKIQILEDRIKALLADLDGAHGYIALLENRIKELGGQLPRA